MEKIVTHPLYTKCKKVLASCETPEQLETALKYCVLAEIKTIPLSIEDCRTHYYAWSNLRREAKWN